MLNSFLTIGEQIFIVFLLMAVGYIGGKTGLITNALADGMSLLVMNIAIPASIIMAFQREFESRLVHEFLLSIILALLGYVLFLTVAFLTIRDKDRKRRNTLIFTAVFANCAMVALPLQSSLFGADGVFCGAVAVAMFDLIFWPLGTLMMTPGEKPKKGELLKKCIVNPCVIANLVALALFFGRITIPSVPAQALDKLGGLCLPLCMLVLGQKLTRRPLAELFTDRGSLLAAAERLVLFPLLIIAVMKLLHIGGTAAMSALIAMASPSAASVVMIAVAYKQDSELAASSVALSTVLSLLTMPPVIFLGSILLL